jgi:hypothetical protein
MAQPLMFMMMMMMMMMVIGLLNSGGLPEARVPAGRTGYSFRQRLRFYSLLLQPIRSWGSFSLLSNGYQNPVPSVKRPGFKSIPSLPRPDEIKR